MHGSPEARLIRGCSLQSFEQKVVMASKFPAVPVAAKRCLADTDYQQDGTGAGGNRFFFSF